MFNWQSKKREREKKKESPDSKHLPASPPFLFFFFFACFLEVNILSIVDFFKPPGHLTECVTEREHTVGSLNPAQPPPATTLTFTFHILTELVTLKGPAQCLSPPPRT